MPGKGTVQRVTGASGSVRYEVTVQVDGRRVEKLMAEGRMTAAGLAAVERAKANGSWAALDDVEALKIPDDLHAALAAEPAVLAGFEALAPSKKKSALWWIVSARTAGTRARRIEETVARIKGA